MPMSLPLRSGGKANRATAWLGPGLGIAILLAPGQLPATAAAPQDSRNPRPEDAPETRAELPEARERHVITSIQELEQALAGQELAEVLLEQGLALVQVEADSHGHVSPRGVVRLPMAEIAEEGELQDPSLRSG